MRFLRHWPLWLCFALVFGVGAARADEPVRTNLDLMTDLTSDAVEELLRTLPSNPGKLDVSLAPHVADESHDFIGNIFTRVLAAHGYSVLAGKPMPGVARNGIRVEYQALDFNLVYTGMPRSFLIGGRRVERSANVKLFAKFVDESNESVLSVGEASRSHEDEFAHSLLPKVEAGSFTFTKPPHESAKWGKVVEPVVVSGIIVGLIYLFFSNQTGN